MFKKFVLFHDYEKKADSRSKEEKEDQNNQKKRKDQMISALQ